MEITKSSELEIMQQYFDSEEIKKFRELMMYYECAMLEVRTKLDVLNVELSLRKNRNPIETIKSRLKSPESIIEKLGRKHIDFSIEEIEKELNDIAGIRVICSFPDDIYDLVDYFVSQDDIRLITIKDYIRTPKPNGYRSLHLIVEVPIFLSDQKKPVRVEVQFRTIGMDFWASLEHKIKYKKDIRQAEKISEELFYCAQLVAQLDARMQQIRKKIEINEK